MMKAIIIGATSGIGWELATIMHAQGYEIGITGRRTEKLRELQTQLGSRVHIQTMDVMELEEARTQFQTLLEQMGGADVVVVNAGVGASSLRWDIEYKTLQTNIMGFCAIANAAFYHFTKQGSGHLVGISSVAAERPSGQLPAYHASKIAISAYMKGLRYRTVKKRLPIHITDIRPGFVITPLTEQNKVMVWASTANKAANQIYTAIKRKKRVAYITRRWWLAATVMRWIPDFIYARLV